jgi:hypothetical protein
MRDGLDYGAAIMSKAKWRFAPSEVRRAITTVRDAGLTISSVKIGADSSIIIGTADQTNKNGTTISNEWDEEDGAPSAAIR